jgi:hypothetical protein
VNKTEQELFEVLLSTPEGKAKLQQVAKSLDNNSYSDFIDVLYDKLKVIFSKLENSRDKHFSHDEDSITGVIAGRLEEAGYIATEQTKKNGAVDLTVQLGNHKWIAEAKIAYSNSKILEGLLQLLTRYVTRDNHAGLLIYIKKPNSERVFNDWKSYLEGCDGLKAYIGKKNSEVRGDLECVLGNVGFSDIDNLSFNSKHHLVSGTSINVQHFCADLYFNPGDISGNNANNQRKNNAINGLANLYFEHLDSNNDFDSDKCIEYLERLFRELDPDDIRLDE